MAKKQTLEQRARQLDIDKSLTITEASRRIAKKLDANLGTIRNYLQANRKGFSSHAEMQAKKAGFNSIAELHEENAKKRGYQSGSHYRRTMEVITGYNLQDNQEIFERQIELKPNDFLDLQASLENVINCESQEVLEIALGSLEEEESYVMRQRALTKRTLKNIGKELGKARETIRLIEEKASNLIRKNLGFETKGPQKERDRDVFYSPIEDGEILLVHILSKSRDFQMPENYKIPRADTRKISDFINENYHEGVIISSPLRTSQIRTLKSYKERLNNLKAKYFPRPNPHNMTYQIRYKEGIALKVTTSCPVKLIDTSHNSPQITEYQVRTDYEKTENVYTYSHTDSRHGKGMQNYPITYEDLEALDSHNPSILPIASVLGKSRADIEALLTERKFKAEHLE